MSTNSRNSFGIGSIGLCIPNLALDLTELAKLRNIDPAKYLVGMGCQTMALCSSSTGVAELATEAARRALKRWPGNLEQIGLIAVGTESALDMSRPLSAWIADSLGIRGHVRSYEVKHACYGGTLALRQALEWKIAGVAENKAALVIAADVALYKPQDPGEPTQGAGAVAMIIDEPSIASIGLNSYTYSEPSFDFWRPVGETYPSVDSKYSLDCYIKAAQKCFNQLIHSQVPNINLEQFSALCFHTPFPKMVTKAFNGIAEMLGWTEEKTQRIFEEKVQPTMVWNRLIGNTYTASLWFAVASALAYLDENEEIAAFSYGSGFGSELFTLKAGPKAKIAAWTQDWENDFANRHFISAQEYEELRLVK